MKNENFKHNSRGTMSVEVALALGILIVIFLAASKHLMAAGQTRRDSSLNVVSTMLPCEGEFASIQGACE